MNSKLHTAEMDRLFDAVLSLKDREDCYKFFSDICTAKELLAMAQRLEVAILLEGKTTYLDIAEMTGASTATISRVNRCLNYGEDGYLMIFDRLGIKADSEKE
ncbi:MAG: YerC/YecD family TrpR-related protein [Eubacteriales bacterium]|nr:YerC/YecD family TrpR-related protein [Eubacteriales bacterium]